MSPPFQSMINRPSLIFSWIEHGFLRIKNLAQIQKQQTRLCLGYLRLLHSLQSPIVHWTALCTVDRNELRKHYCFEAQRAGLKLSEGNALGLTTNNIKSAEGAASTPVIPVIDATPLGLSLFLYRTPRALPRASLNSARWASVSLIC